MSLHTQKNKKFSTGHQNKKTIADRLNMECDVLVAVLTGRYPNISPDEMVYVWKQIMPDSSLSGIPIKNVTHQ
jgi:hypothetical protein